MAVDVGATPNFAFGGPLAGFGTVFGGSVVGGGGLGDLPSGIGPFTTTTATQVELPPLPAFVASEPIVRTGARGGFEAEQQFSTPVSEFPPLATLDRYQLPPDFWPIPSDPTTATFTKYNTQVPTLRNSRFDPSGARFISPPRSEPISDPRNRRAVLALIERRRTGRDVRFRR